MPVHDVVRHNYEGSGLILTLGAHPRAYDPKEERYRLTRTIDVSGIDLSKPYSLVEQQASGLWDPRPPITDQGQKGACASFAIIEAAEICSWQSGNGQPVPLSGSDTYERVRKVEDGANWRADSGSTLAGNCDLAMGGLYSVAEAPESDDLALDYDTETAGKPSYDYVLGHQPFYPGETSDPDFFIKAIAYFISQRMPVDLGSYWPTPWFTPDGNGVLPMAGVSYQGAGGHSYLAEMVLPILGGVVACANHWTSGFNPQVARNGYDLRPGDFLVPFSAFRNGFFFEGRGISWQPVNPTPPPPPSGCKAQALALAQPVLEGYAATLTQHPRSATARYGLRGAQAVVTALSQMPE